MLDRPPNDAKPAPSADAIRARKSRALRKAGFVSLRVKLKRRRVVAFLRRSNPNVGPLETTAQIEAELTSYMEAVMVRWLGPKISRPRDDQHDG
jgi:hypothetical protein